jgi:cysteine desulfuration protein SufE
MIIDDKLDEYKNAINELQEIDNLEVYQWMISLGKKLNDDPLSEEKRISENRVSRCQFSLFVAWENGKFKAWSDAMISSGYAYILLDVFNSSPIEEAKQITMDHFQKIKMDQLLTMNRKNGFYEMIEMMIKRIKTI